MKTTPRLVDDVASFGGFGRKLLDVTLVEIVKQVMKLIRDARLRYRIAIGVCRDGKTIGDGDPLRRQNGIQLAERSRLAADKTDVAQANFEERSDII